MGIQQAERGIALLRMVVGFWILREALSHVIWTPWPWAAAYWVQHMTTELAAHSLDHPAFWVRYIIQQALLPNAELYVGLGVVFELLAGVSLTFGVLTVPGAALAVLLSVNQGVLSHYRDDVLLGLVLIQGAAAVVFMVTRAGRRWGFDAFLAGIKERALLW